MFLSFDSPACLPGRAIRSAGSPLCRLETGGTGCCCCYCCCCCCCSREASPWVHTAKGLCALTLSIGVSRADAWMEGSVGCLAAAAAAVAAAEVERASERAEFESAGPSPADRWKCSSVCCQEKRKLYAGSENSSLNEFRKRSHFGNGYRKLLHHKDKDQWGSGELQA